MTILNKLVRTSVLMGCLIGLVSCVGLEPGYKSKITKESYLVQKGDTLYSIAFRYGIDYKSLAKINGIKPIISPNQNNFEVKIYFFLIR